jgi:hypothetical protein
MPRMWKSANTKLKTAAWLMEYLYQDRGRRWPGGERRRGIEVEDNENYRSSFDLGRQVFQHSEF